MIELPFGCYCTDLKVTPKNWQTNKSTIKKEWMIYYRFYDPRFKQEPKFKKGKLVVLKGMNPFTNFPERVSKTREIIQAELDKLKNKGYNPITAKFVSLPVEVSEITPSTPLMEALELGSKRLVIALSTARDIRSILESVREAAYQLRYTDLPVVTVNTTQTNPLPPF
ncbi:hypothetical protein ESA94_20310 [Lacibacter luteus]|uniref:Uncharacterized protein n=1 Tax=Lacibacter luteus TaxID=2508719 RepID=A0A4Q1CE00_9BACT|nr:hypothetical protein [Lacibacter luteus]RXK57864.1 hypothetical protein ESA94_20310 [Lacibacter luteus]